jgi:hypothetical protein
VAFNAATHGVGRRLSDEEFSEVLKFTQAAFETALAFRSRKGAA